MTKLKQYIDTFTVFKKVHELCNIYMLDRTMNFDFTHQFLFSSASLQRWLQYNFRCCDFLIITSHEFVALSKASLTQEFAFNVLSVANLTILMLDSFLNNLCGLRPVSCLRQKVGLAAAVLRMLLSLNHPSTLATRSSSASPCTLWWRTDSKICVRNNMSLGSIIIWHCFES